MRNKGTQMNQQTGSAQTWLALLNYRSHFLQKLAWLGGVGLLSGGTLWAQTPPDAVVVPVIPEPEPSLEAAPAEPTEPELAPPVEAFEPELPVSEADIIPLDPSALESEPLVVDEPATEVSPSPADGSTAYIDPTDYNIGATSTYDSPSSVVLSERSTGCLTILENGQNVSGDFCQPAASTPSNNWNGQPVVATAAWDNSPAAMATVVPQTVQLGPISISSGGMGVGQTTAAGRLYYRTTRPTGRLGNGNISLIFPLSIPAPITSFFGWRTHPISGDQRFHSGTDIGAPLGTPVLAAYAGRVALSDFLGGYGLTVVLEHNKSTQETLYAHLSELFVKPGEWVEQGTVIGRVGSTGNSTGPHLHFEFRQLTPEGWVALDPGAQLEYALGELVKSLQTAQAKPQPRS